MMTPLEAVTAVDLWIAPARAVHQVGGCVDLVIAPGDFTRYSLTFTAGAAWQACTNREHAEVGQGCGVAAMLTGGRAIAWSYALDGYPHPNYVAEKIGSDNACTIAAVGIVWALLVGVTVEMVAEMYEHPMFEHAFSLWEPTAFEVKS